MTNENSNMPSDSVSYWRASTKLPKFPTLDNHLHVDVCVVGGGITGVTAAYELAKNGKSVVLVEADEVLNGTTGFTTAKITTQHGLIYDQIKNTTSVESARIYYEANHKAARWMQQKIKREKIACDYEIESAYLYATTDEGEKKLEAEFAAYDQIGIPGEFVREMPFNIPIKAAVHLPNQAQFHPLHYIQHFIETYTQLGGQIYEQTTALNISEHKVYMENGSSVKADHILVCTHFPFYEGRGLYSARMYASRSYVLAAKTKQTFPGGMYINVEKPDRSLRSVTIDEKPHVLIIGEGHRTGDKTNTMQHYSALYQFGVEHFGIEQVAYRWSGQDLITLDQLPYVGPITKDKPHILIATGYRKWGMTNGTAAALLLADIVLEKGNPYLEVVSPSRELSLVSAKNALEQNWIVAKNLISGKLQQAIQTIDNMENDSGATVQIDGEKKGVYKNAEGNIYIVDTTCTHIGCEVNWNNGEKSWDCPCHGSRFSYTGEVLEGPAEKPLQTYDYKMLDNLTSDESGY